MESSMPSKHLIITILLMALLAGAVLLYERIVSQPTPRADLKATCCAECLAAWGQSPAGYGSEGASCGVFPTGKPLGEQCEEYFRQNPTMVAECR
jgi:hypothetical protein